MKMVGSFLADWWRLASPYFRSSEWPIAVLLLVGSIGITFGVVGLEVMYNDWSRRFYDALEKKDQAAFWHEILVFCGLSALFIAAYMARVVVTPYLQLRWRRWLTARYLSHWLDGRGYYRIELERTVDNADQRIAEDLRQLGDYTMSLLLGLLKAVATLGSFIFILWQLSGSLSLAPIGIDIEIPGYMAIAALIYAIIGTFFADLVGRRLILLNFQRQRYEADFRFSLVRVRENAEGIALYRGENREAENLNARFADVFANKWKVIKTQAQFTFYDYGYTQIAIIFPYLVTAPRFFAGAITLGVMMQTASAFNQVRTALSFFVDNYTSLAELRAVLDRLDGLQAATDAKPVDTLDVAPLTEATDVSASGLTLALPTGQPLLQDVSFALPRGQATLLTGASGSGKSTLFRALAGIWPFGRGQVQVPAGARVLFLPQKPYIPIGTLRDAVKYPDENSTASDLEIVEVLQAAQLGHLAGRLDEEVHWSNILSGGEQQRLAVARALAFKPDWLFLDEATASLDEPAEAAVYGELKRRLPNTTLVSIGHRPTLRKWHDRRLDLQRVPGETGRLVQVPLSA